MRRIDDRPGGAKLHLEPGELHRAQFQRSARQHHRQARIELARQRDEARFVGAYAVQQDQARRLALPAAGGPQAVSQSGPGFERSHVECVSHRRLP
ncbi:hypothetical protein LP420_35075 [Massilia sp. B-10]|nr:hypothetical protein LP420_35075 [Massilia sp. B-10]